MKRNSKTIPVKMKSHVKMCLFCFVLISISIETVIVKVIVLTAALKHGIRNPETETESRKRKRNTESNINDRKLKNFTLHNLVQSKENLS